MEADRVECALAKTSKYALKSKTVHFGGVDIEVLSIGRVAARIGRSSKTLRRWEKLGFIPAPSFVGRGKRRYYTSEEIEVLARLMQECGMLKGRDVVGTGFKEKATAEFMRLRDMYRRVARESRLLQQRSEAP